MTCRLLQNIKHTCDYNPGGITGIYLLDINDFAGYQFAGDIWLDTCYVEKIDSPDGFLELDTVAESTFVESHENEIFKQELNTFIHTLEGSKLSDLLIANVNKYVVTFRTSQGKMYSFGSDGGASLSFSQITGQMGEVSGYQIKLSKNSVYPLFEVNAERFNTVSVLATEDNLVLKTEDGLQALKVFSDNMNE